MRKREFIIALLSLTIFSFAYGGNKKHKTDWDKEGLKGKVKTLHMVRYQAKIDSGKVKKGDTLYEFSVSFDKDGNDLERMEHNRSKHTRLVEFNTYNEKGQCIEKKQEDHYTDTNTNKYRTVYKYDTLGNNVEEDTYMNSEKGCYNRTINKYDTNGNLVECFNIIGLGKQDTSASKQKFKYDKKGNVLEWETYGDDGIVDYKKINTYDTLGRIEQTSIYMPNVNLRSRGFGKYDKNGNLTEWTDYDKMGKILKKLDYINNYDYAGNLKRQVTLIKGKATLIAQYVIVYY